MLVLWLIVSCMILFAACLVIISCNTKLNVSKNKQYINNTSNSLLYCNNKANETKYCKRKQATVLASIFFFAIATVYLYKTLGFNYELNLSRQLNKNISTTEFYELIADWVKHKPNNEMANWMVAKWQIQNNNFIKAEKIYRKLLKLNPKASLYWSELGQLLFLSNNNVVSTEIRRYYQVALEINANDITALELKGIDCFSRNQYKQAKQAWELALEQEVSIEGKQALKAGILQAKSKLGESVATIPIRIHIDTTNINLKPNSRIVVFARVPRKNSLPLAVETVAANKHPVTLILNDASVSMDSKLLSEVDNVDIVARLTESTDVKSYSHEITLSNISTSNKTQLELTFTKDSKICE